MATSIKRVAQQKIMPPWFADPQYGHFANERSLSAKEVSTNYRVDASFAVGTDLKLAGLHPHMHTRGKDFAYRIVDPDGRTETILRVPKYNWRWQLWYNLADPLFLPKGTKIECTAHFDNSADNPENPDPTKTVVWGQQSWDEMMVGFFNLVFDAKTPAKALFPDHKNRADLAQN